jgi:hypothetical protein
MYTSKKKIHIKILIGTIIIIISTIIILYIIFTNYFNNKQNSISKIDDSLNALKQKVQEFQKGNAAANKNDLKCYVNILYDNLKLNVETEDVYNILQSNGLKSKDYKDGLLSSISILSKALNKNMCYVYKPLNTLNEYNNVSNYTIFNSKGLQKVFENDKDPVGAPYTEYSFLTFVYFLSNLYTEGEEKNIIPLSNNLKLLNEQLFKANAFKISKTKSGKKIIPYNKDKEIINITITPFKKTTKLPFNKKPNINNKNLNTDNSKQTNVKNIDKIYIPIPILFDNRSQDQYNYFSNNNNCEEKIPNYKFIDPYKTC